MDNVMIPVERMAGEGEGMRKRGKETEERQSDVCYREHLQKILFALQCLIVCGEVGLTWLFCGKARSWGRQASVAGYRYDRGAARTFFFFLCGVYRLLLLRLPTGVRGVVWRREADLESEEGSFG